MPVEKATIQRQKKTPCRRLLKTSRKNLRKNGMSRMRSTALTLNAKGM